MDGRGRGAASRGDHAIRGRRRAGARLATRRARGGTARRGRARWGRPRATGGRRRRRERARTAARARPWPRPSPPSPRSTSPARGCGVHRPDGGEHVPDAIRQGRRSGGRLQAWEGAGGKGRCLKGPTPESGRRWSTWARATRLARPAPAFRVGCSRFGGRNYACPRRLTGRWRGGAPLPQRRAEAAGSLAPLGPGPGPARVTLGEPPSPPRAVLGSRRPRGLGGGFHAGSGRRVLKPRRRLGAPGKWELNHQQLPTRPNSRNWVFWGQEMSFLSSGFHFSPKTLLGAELNQLVIATPEV